MLLRAPPCRGAAPRRGAAAPRELRCRAAPRRCCAAARGDNDRQARAEEAAQQRTARALDASLAAITRLVGVGDMFGGVGSSRPALPPGQEAAPPADADVKRVSFRARAKSKRQVAQAASERLFCDYLALPAEEYSLLDPRWVSRIDDCTFRFTVPLGAVLSELSQGAPVPGGLLKLEPAITVRTELDRDVRRVTLRGSDATLGLAGSGLERGFSLGFTTTMTWSGGPAEGGAADNTVTPWGLACAVEVQGSLGLGPPLAKLPGPILGAFVSLLGTAVAQAVLPRFAETLAEDYARWAVGKDRFSSSGALLGVGSSSDGDIIVDVASSSDGHTVEVEPLAAPEPPAAAPE